MSVTSENLSVNNIEINVTGRSVETQPRTVPSTVAFNPTDKPHLSDSHERVEWGRGTWGRGA